MRPGNVGASPAERSTCAGGVKEQGGHRGLSAEQRKRSSVRAYANVYQKRGKLVAPTECERCGKAPPAEKHHGDYSAPLVVTWLCRPCHIEVTRKELSHA